MRVDLNSFPLGELEETTRSGCLRSYYVDEGYWISGLAG